MALSKEWWEYHLTPDGWVDGNYRLDFGNMVSNPTPEGRVLTLRETQTMNHSFRVDTTWVEVFRCDDDELILKLIAKYGDRRRK